jgi:bacterioferritin-associated ferredoxin
MIVCVCRRISDHQIRHAAAEGAMSLECLKTELGVATQCGRCADCASRILCDARSASASGTPMLRMHQAEQMA